MLESSVIQLPLSRKAAQEATRSWRLLTLDYRGWDRIKSEESDRSSRKRSSAQKKLDDPRLSFSRRIHRGVVNPE